MIIFNGKRITLAPGQTVLSALLEQEHEIPNSCRAGVCQSCLMQATEGEIPESAQQGLRDTLKQQGYFLACSCIPESELKIQLANTADVLYTAEVVEHSLLGEDVLRLRLKVGEDFEYKAGQYITIRNSQNIARSYSLASVADLDDYLELHIRRIPEGRMSNWLHDQVGGGDTLQIQAACGNCFYIPSTEKRGLLLSGTGTGLAPLLGIARDGLQQGHQGEIHLVHGAVYDSGLYLHQILKDMAEQYENFFYHASVLHSENAEKVPDLPIDQLTMHLAGGDFAGWNYYLCGDPKFVNDLKRKLFVQGAGMSSIYADPFIGSSAD